MKKLSSKVLRSALSAILAICMVVGMCTTALAVEPQKKYVSLGDSMTNGLGLGGGYDSTGHNGYLEEDTNAYPSIIATNKGWDLTQLATSAMRARDLNYILAYDAENDAEGIVEADEWTNKALLNHRWGTAAETATQFQTSVSEADVITLAAGNGDFGVYMMDMLTTALGISSYNGDDYSFATLEAAIELAGGDAEVEALVMDIYGKILAYFGDALPQELVDTLAGRMIYVVTDFVINYAGALDRIVELNSDVEIIIVGLMNTMSGYGVNVTYQGATYYIDMAAVLDVMLNPLNAYLAALPTVKQELGEYAEAKLYYAEVDRIETLAVTYKEAYEENPDFYEQRFIEDIVGFIFPVLDPEETTLARDITADDVEAYRTAGSAEAYVMAGGVAKKAPALLAYTTLVDAILNAVMETPDVNLDDMATIALTEGAGAMDYIGALLNQKMAEANGDMAAALEDGTIKALLGLYGRMKLANGAAAHPTKGAHQAIAAEIMAAYGNHTVQDETMDNVNTAVDAVVGIITEYYDEAYAYAYDYADENGYIDAAADAIDGVIVTLENVDLAAVEMTDAFRADAAAAIAEVIETLEAAKALLLEADELDEDTLNAVIALLNDAYADLEALDEVFIQAAVDVNQLVIIPAINEALDQLEKVDAYIAGILRAVNDGYNALIAAIVANYENTLAGEYVISEDSYYVAIGDETAYGELVAAEIGLEADQFVALDADGITVLNIADVLDAEGVAAVSAADFITVGFGNSMVLEFVAECIEEIEPVEFDWAALVTEAGVPYVEKALAEVEAYFVEAGVEGEILDKLMLAVEAYAYGYTAMAISVPALVEAIREINSEALVIMVGMYNPLEGVVLTYEDLEINLGEYIGYFVDAANAELFVYALISENTMYVDAPDVETSLAAGEYKAINFVMSLEKYIEKTAPTEAGHEYIKDQIMNALTITVEESGLIGDVNGDGVVNNIDATLVLRYSVGALSEEQLAKLYIEVGNVNGDEKVNNIDATIILRYSVGAVEALPVA